MTSDSHHVAKGECAPAGDRSRAVFPPVDRRPAGEAARRANAWTSTAAVSADLVITRPYSAATGYRVRRGCRRAALRGSCGRRLRRERLWSGHEQRRRDFRPDEPFPKPLCDYTGITARWATLSPGPVRGLLTEAVLLRKRAPQPTSCERMAELPKA